jgi:RNA polymerase sigma-70 factor, ECF subfamily
MGEADNFLELYPLPAAISSDGIMAGIASSDGELVRRFRSGDREAFAALYRMHYPAVFRFVWHMTGDRIEALEITQDVFVWLIHHPGDYDARRGTLRAFLGGVARKMLSRERQMARRWTPLEEAKLGGADPAVDFVRAGDAAILRRAISALPVKYREAIVLCDLEGKSYEEAAATLGCATGTVRSRLHRARGLLARKLEWKREGERCAV